MTNSNKIFSEMLKKNDILRLQYKLNLINSLQKGKKKFPNLSKDFDKAIDYWDKK